MEKADIVDRLKAAAEHDEGIDPAETQALFIEAAEAIETLRLLLDLGEDADLEFTTPHGTA